MVLPANQNQSHLDNDDVEDKLKTTFLNSESEDDEEAKFDSAKESFLALDAYKRTRTYGNNPSALEVPPPSSNGDDYQMIMNETFHHDDEESIATVGFDIDNDLFQMDDLFLMDDDDDDNNNNYAEAKLDDGDEDVSSIKTEMKDEDLNNNNNDDDNVNGDINEKGDNDSDNDDEQVVHDQTQDVEQNDGIGQEDNTSGNESAVVQKEENASIDERDVDEDNDLPMEDDDTSDASSEKESTAPEDKEDDNKNDDSFSLTQEDKIIKEGDNSSSQEAMNSNVSDAEPDTNDEAMDRLSSRELKKKIRHLFYSLSKEEKKSLSVKQFKRTLENIIGMKLDSDEKEMMKELVGSLFDAENSSDESDNDDEDDEEEEQSSTESDYDEPSTRSKGKKKSPKGKKVKAGDGSAKFHSPLTRSQTKPRKPRKPSHLKIHEEMRRKKLLAEAKVRDEELQSAAAQKMNEEDMKRAQLIAKKFDTNTEEARIKRMEDRIGLLEKLKQKRLDLLSVEQRSLMDNDDEDSEKLSSLASHGNVGGGTKLQVTTASSNSDNSSEESSDEDDDFELEIIKKVPKTAITRRKSPTSVLDMFGLKSNPAKVIKNQKQSTIVSSFTNPRAALRNALRAKQFESGNRWLAKELGYDKPEDHIRECKLKEMKKQQQIFKKEEASLQLVQERNERLVAIFKGEVQEDEELEFVGDQDNVDENFDRMESENEEGQEEENEELAMARAIESERNELNENESQNADAESVAVSDADEGMVHDFTEPLETSTTLAEEDRIIHDNTQVDIDQEQNENSPGEASEDHRSKENGKSNEDQSHAEHAASSSVENDEFENSSKHESLNVELDEPKDKRPKNAAWKAMLAKEKEILKKQKSIRKGQAIDDEAEEEEEEEGVAGLEDFGFITKDNQKGDDDDDDDNDADDDDLDNIVDEVSDGEGDEEAGDKARKAMQAKEEKLKHKEVLRRIREGYDGRRGGVAGGSSKRGNLRFDQLVAADNRSDAKRLGLLNDDELDSDIEDADGNGEVEDEAMLIDKMIKDRYLNTISLPEENFSDSEEENEDEQDGTGPKNEEEEEDLEQERLAKRFAKRARMNRLLELHGDDEEFTQSRLLDEDEDLRNELKKIRTVRGKRVRQVSTSSLSTSNSSNHAFTSTANINLQNKSQQKSFLPYGSTLSIALNQSRSTSKRKTSFLGGSDFSNRSKSSIKTQAVSLGHVVFTGENSNHNSSLSKGTSTVSRASSFTSSNSKGGLPQARKRNASTLSKDRSSLWSKVSSSSFSKRRKG